MKSSILKFLMCLSLICCWLSFAAQSTARPQGEAQSKKFSAEPQPPLKPTEAKTSVGEDFIIGSGDMLNIFVWKEPEFSKTVPVRPDGKISLPLVNDVQASGLTAMQLKDLITSKLKEFITAPTVTVTVEAVHSQKVTIMGEVTGVGPRPLTGPTRIMDVLAGSGFTPFAKTTKICVLRNENGKQERFIFNYKDYLKGKNPEQNLLLKNGDTIIVP